MKFIKILQTNGNKGFTLIELIMVIAIATILTGLIATNLVRYIERTNVSADSQLANRLRMALITSLGDPVTDGPQKDKFKATYTMSLSVPRPVPLSDASFAAVDADDTFAMSIGDTLMLPSYEITSGMLSFMRSKRNDPQFAVLLTRDNVIVVITGTDRTAAFGGTPPEGLTAQSIVMGCENALGPYY
jgi:prepilin-type N-terminal cleavage/methylation domain-containing protein